MIQNDKVIKNIKHKHEGRKEGVKKCTSLRIIGFGFLSNNANVFEDAY